MLFFLPFSRVTMRVTHIVPLTIQSIEDIANQLGMFFFYLFSRDHKILHVVCFPKSLDNEGLLK